MASGSSNYVESESAGGSIRTRRPSLIAALRRGVVVQSTRCCRLNRDLLSDRRGASSRRYIRVPLPPLTGDLKWCGEDKFAVLRSPEAHDLFGHEPGHDGNIKTKPISTSSFIYLVFVDAARYSLVVNPRGFICCGSCVSFLLFSRRRTQHQQLTRSLVFQRQDVDRPAGPRLMPPADSVDDEWDAECQGLRMGGHVRRRTYINCRLPQSTSLSFPPSNLLTLHIELLIR